VRVLNWPDYIEPSVLQDFEKETGIRVVYDVFAGNDDLQTKLSRRRWHAYDVVFPTANAVPAMAAKGLLGKLDKTSLKNLGNLDPRVDATLRAWDKDGAYSLPYMWYTVGIAWNPKLTAKAAPGQAMDALANVFDADTARRFQSCGVGVVDSASDVVPLAAMAGGVSKWDSKTSVAAASKVLDRLAGVVKVIPTDQFIDQLATGKVCVAIGFSGDAVQAQSKARGNVEYRVPSDGGLLAIDAMAVAANAKNKREAHQFIDYLLRPQVIAKISNTVGYANANLKAGEFMSDAVKSNPAVVPSPRLAEPLLADSDPVRAGPAGHCPCLGQVRQIDADRGRRQTLVPGRFSEGTRANRNALLAAGAGGSFASFRWACPGFGTGGHSGARGPRFWPPWLVPSLPSFQGLGRPLATVLMAGPRA
jgi:putrescine transport system substrate-binding protein